MNILIVDNKVYCLNCMKETDGTKYCDESCRRQYGNAIRRKQEYHAKPCPVCGKPFVETRVKKHCSRACTEKSWRMKNKPTKQLPLIAPVKKDCDCRQYQTCMICRNAEKRRAFKAGEIPAYRVTLLQQAIGD